MISTNEADKIGRRYRLTPRNVEAITAAAEVLADAVRDLFRVRSSSARQLRRAVEALGPPAATLDAAFIRALNFDRSGDA